ncbi:MAG TPA: hypothetical protein PLG90_11990 [Ignavibacteria bacterium]|nr:hypothetical protein [Ignavibacteria bacterium]
MSRKSKEKKQVPEKKSNPIKCDFIDILKLFNRRELWKFEQFIKSPMFNKRKILINYFMIMKKYYPKFDNKNFSKEKVFSELYPERTYKDDILRRYNNCLKDLAEEFATYNTFTSDRYEKKFRLLMFFINKKSDKFFTKQFKDIIEFTDKYGKSDIDYFNKKSILTEIYRSFKLKDDPTYKHSGYEEQINYILKYFLNSILRLYGFAEYERYFFNKKYDLKFLDEIKKMVLESDYFGSKSIEIYHKVLNLYNENNSDNNLNEVKNLIIENGKLFEREELFNLYIHLFNGINISKLKTNKEYNELEFEIAKKMDEDGLLIFNGVIDPGWFRGIFFKYYNAGKTGGAIDFLERYKTKVAGEYKAETVHHLYAVIDVHNRDYESALEHLGKASYLNINDKWAVKNLYLKIYYETNRFEEFLYVSDSIKHLISENPTWSENIVKPIRNFINLAGRLFRVKIGDSKLDSGEMERQIRESETIGRSWLLEKVKELDGCK